MPVSTALLGGRVVVLSDDIPQVQQILIYLDGELLVTDGDSVIQPPVATGIEPYGSNSTFFPSGNQLPPLEDGPHRLRMEVLAVTGNVFVEEFVFLVDTTPPEVEIISPADDVVNYVIDPVLEYSATDATSGVGFVEVSLDGEILGNIPSGTPLTGLKDGLHTLVLRVQDLAKDASGNGHETTVSVSFITATDFSINTVGTPGAQISFVHAENTGQRVGFASHTYIGSDASGQYQADGVIEEMRILDFASTDADVRSDYLLLLNGFRFQNTENGVNISAEDQTALETQSIDVTRLNQPDNTLALFHFDNSIQSEEGVSNKEQTSNVLISLLAASNDVDVNVRVPQGEIVDRDLVTTLLGKISSVHTQIFTTFEEVE